MKISFKNWKLHNCDNHLSFIPLFKILHPANHKLIKEEKTGLVVFCTICGRVKDKWEYDELKVSNYEIAGLVSRKDLFLW